MRLLVTALALWLLAIVPAAAQREPWTGEWDTRWPDGGARLTLEQHGAAVTGRYPLYGGTLSGIARDDRLEGEWREGPRHGHFLFVLGPFRRGFTGRFDGTEWWTGERATAPLPEPDTRDGTPQDTLRSFALAGNIASAGFPDVMGEAVRLLDFGPANPDARARLGLAQALYRAVALTTFRSWSLPAPEPGQRAITYALRQAGSEAVLPLNLTQTADGHWRIAVSDADALAAAYRTLLKRHGGTPPAQDEAEAQRSPRDTMRKFIMAMRRGAAGDERVLETLDLSSLRAGYREDQGLLQAQYMLQVISRIGAWDWQQIPDDPAGRDEYVFFDHPTGRIAIAPQPAKSAGEPTRWRFTADTVTGQVRLYITTEGMPPAWGMAVPLAGDGLFALRARLAAISPWLLARSVFIGLENWQIVLLVLALLVAILAVKILVPLVSRGIDRLLALLGQAPDEPIGARLIWPLRILAVALVWYHVTHRIGMTGPGLTLADSLMGVLVAIGIAWAGLPIVDAAAHGLHGRAQQTSGSMDDILVSLTAGVLKLVLIAGVAVVAAQAVGVPVGGLLAGLGIGGLAVAFASKEALSNLFGAGILLVDRPFRNGDTIAIGEVQGTVEHVGIRSTRIRTLDDTVVVLPNGKLSDALINNYGARRYRLFRTRFAAAGTPEQMEEFTRRLRSLVDTHPATAEERTQVGMSELTADGASIDLVCYIRAQSANDERSARHELLLQIMRLAQEIGIRVAGA